MILRNLHALFSKDKDRWIGTLRRHRVGTSDQEVARVFEGVLPFFLDMDIFLNYTTYTPRGLSVANFVECLRKRSPLTTSEFILLSSFSLFDQLHQTESKRLFGRERVSVLKELEQMSKCSLPR